VDALLRDVIMQALVSVQAHMLARIVIEFAVVDLTAL
jgi:hypothetical protein